MNLKFQKNTSAAKLFSPIIKFLQLKILQIFLFKQILLQAIVDSSILIKRAIEAYHMSRMPKEIPHFNLHYNYPEHISLVYNMIIVLKGCNKCKKFVLPIQ